MCLCASYIGKRDINAFLLPSKDFYAHVQFLSIYLMHSHVNCSSCSHQSCIYDIV